MEKTSSAGSIIEETRVCRRFSLTENKTEYTIDQTDIFQLINRFGNEAVRYLMADIR